MSLTKLQEAELAAICGDRDAVLAVVSALRRYRQAIERTLSSGDIYYHAVYTLPDTVAEIEADGGVLGSND